MIYESPKMRLKCIQVVKKGPVNDIMICQDIDVPGSSLYTLLAVKKHKTARKFLEIIEKAERQDQEYLVDCFSLRGDFFIAFPYKQERPLKSFYNGSAYKLAECEDICINVILTCISSGLPYPLLYLILEQRQLNLARDHSVYLGYELDLEQLDPDKTERDCTVQCARVLMELLEPKASQKAVSYQLLQKKTAKRSYQKFTELYKDIRIASAPKKKKGIRAMLKRWFARNRDRLFGILLWICALLILVVIASFVTQAIFGDIPWLRFFFNSFKTIGTESLLQ
ncbi:MAG: hypothetical protein MSH20_04965 [Lachnospiraceae bacterium]|nr:hypothetical protein [Lachnospiraceae bacterium]MDD7147853.1 hypothetical protein [Lachnospiraceae bacterium]